MTQWVEDLKRELKVSLDFGNRDWEFCLPFEDLKRELKVFHLGVQASAASGPRISKEN